MMVGRIRQLRTDLTTAYNPYSLQKILDGTLELMEYMLAGSVTQPNPNHVPGQALDPLDQGKAKVEFFGGPQQPTRPSEPVRNNGDVNFIPGPPPGSPGAVGGQTVEYYGAPPGTQLPGGQTAPQVYEANGQRVEIFGAPPAPSAPVSNQPAAIVHGRPPVTVEAGYAIPPAPGGPPPPSLPMAPAFSEQMSGHVDIRATKPVPTRDDLLAALPIPVLKS